MQIYSSSPKPKFPLPSPSSNPNPSKSHFNIPIKTLKHASPLRIAPRFSMESSPAVEEKLPTVDLGNEKNFQDKENEEAFELDDKPVRRSLKVRRPVMELPKEEIDGSLSGENDGVGGDAITKDLSSSSKVIDAGLSEFAKKMPMFEPKRVELSPEKKPLGVNLELALYRAKVWGREYRFEEAKELLWKCIQFWPEDGRAYVALGKILSKQFQTTEARAVYEKGCQATQGENSYIWQCWAVLENKLGNIRRARELFDAATVADKKHIAAWHGWAVLELKQGNLKKARNLLGKGIKYCGGNEYVYQTLALLEAKANRVEQARYLFKQATKCNPKSCASWLAWAQLEMQQENTQAARKLFEKAVQSSPKNRFAWHVWGMFEANLGHIEKGRKLLKIGHTLNPRDPVLLQSLALLEYKYSSAILARVLFKRASELDPKHQPVWMAWGWMEWKEGNLSTARQLYQRALSIDSTTESAARCLQAWGVLEQRVGNLQAARRLFRSSLNINSQSYVTWMTLASLEEEQGNPERAEEIRDLYFQQRTEVVDDASWVMGFLDIIDPTLDRIKRLLSFDRNSAQNPFGNMEVNSSSNLREDVSGPSSSRFDGTGKEGREENRDPTSDFDLDAFIKEKLSLDASKLDMLVERLRSMDPKTMKNYRSVWTSQNRTAANLI